MPCSSNLIDTVTTFQTSLPFNKVGTEGGVFVFIGIQLSEVWCSCSHCTVFFLVDTCSNAVLLAVTLIVTQLSHLKTHFSELIPIIKDMSVFINWLFYICVVYKIFNVIITMNVSRLWRIIVAKYRSSSPHRAWHLGHVPLHAAAPSPHHLTAGLHMQGELA